MKSLGTALLTLYADHSVVQSFALSIPDNGRIKSITGGMPNTAGASTLTITRKRGAVSDSLFAANPALSAADTIGTTRVLTPDQNMDVVQGDVINIANGAATGGVRVSWIIELARAEGAA